MRSVLSISVVLFLVPACSKPAPSVGARPEPVAPAAAAGEKPGGNGATAPAGTATAAATAKADGCGPDCTCKDHSKCAAGACEGCAGHSAAGESGAAAPEAASSEPAKAPESSSGEPATAPEGAGGIVFHDPRKQNQVLLPSVTTATEMNSTVAQLPAIEGQALLFPSWLEHYTERNESTVRRVSIAFNLMLVGSFGSPETFAAGYVAP